jgi:hypothetical protein
MRHARGIVLLTVVLGSAMLPAEALAQRRRVVRAPVRSVVYVSARPYYRPYLYSPFFYGGFGTWYGGYGWYPYASPWYPYGYYGQPYPYGPYYRDYRGSARLEIRPRNAEVFIDGYFVGNVDDFDGWSQRLHVQPGEHELTVFLPGHRTFRQNVLFRPGATIRIEHVMQPLAAGEPEEARPAPSGRSQPRPAPRAPAPPPRREAPPAAGGATESADYGAVAIRVQPADAEVIVDGETWQSPEAGDLTLQLTDGDHRVEIRKDGYRPYSATVRVRRGATTSLNVSLSRQ